ncbi:cytochrome P450 [Kineosporia sp. NBRC 101731]|uniref:cytochrome P450 n=1 Tax=Kineosporia sp. NBRC 101731 TaxID=3032199 RepID=UPI0024A13603|nr:cytochrome P450 [Kineosporia sp. NBRC 101731]GLY30393.1 cytochrome P450 BJ-3 [Kineosporia sp. NBRC 101731]
MTTSRTHPGTEAEPDVLMQLLMPEGRDDPYPIYARLRHESPLYASQFGAYLISRHEDVDRVLKRADLFPGVDPEMMDQMFPQAVEHEAFEVLVTALVGSNPPKHTRLRGLIGNGFTARRLAGLRHGLEHRTEQVLADVAERLRSGETVDLHESISMPIPMHMISDLIGIPEADRRRLAQGVPEMMNVVDPAATPEAVQRADEAFRALGEYLDGLIARRRSDPRDDLVSMLVAARDEESGRVDDKELRNLLFTLWSAGFETTATAIDNAVLLLLADPSRSRWLENEQSTASFVTETLRYEPSVHVAPGIRFAAQDVELSGGTVPAGAQVRLLIGSANRDGEVFENGDTFDPGRPTVASARPLSFGAGIHYCLGAGLSMVEMGVLLPRLHHLFPSLVLAGPPVRRRSIPLRDFAAIPVRLAD